MAKQLSYRGFSRKREVYTGAGIQTYSGIKAWEYKTGYYQPIWGEKLRWQPV